MKLRKVGNSLGFVLPEEALAELKAREGDALVFNEAPKGILLITASNADFARQMAAAEEVIGRYRNATPRG